MSAAVIEYALCGRAQLHRLPPKVSFGQGAAMGVPYATAFRALFIRAAARPAETVFVHGATGGVGIAAVQIARAHGMGTPGQPARFPTSPGLLPDASTLI